jgi:hypothetical protein
MRSPFINPAKTAVKGLLRFGIVLSLLALPLLSGARPQGNSIRVENNSTNWEVRHLYLSPVDRDDWGPDMLNNSSIGSGQSFTLSDVSCNQSQIRVISEDQNGCFLSAVVSCSGGAVWTITNNAVPDCGN